MNPSIPPELALRMPSGHWITVDDLVAHGWTTRMINSLGEPNRTETTSQGLTQPQFSRVQVLSRWKKPGARRESEAAQARYRFLRNVIGQLDAPGATILVSARTVVVQEFTYGDLRIRIGDLPPYEHSRRISVMLQIDGESAQRTDALFESVSRKLRQTRAPAAGTTMAYHAHHPRRPRERSAGVETILDRPYGADARTGALWKPHGRDLPWVLTAANMFRSDLAPLIQSTQGQNATSSTAAHGSQQVEAETQGFRPGVNTGSGPKLENGTGRGGHRRCPVCGNGGLADGRSRHQKCEGSRVPAVVPGVVVASDVDVAPGSREIARYRELVSSVERREAATRGRRVERVNHEIVRLDLAR